MDKLGNRRLRPLGMEACQQVRRLAIRRWAMGNYGHCPNIPYIHPKFLQDVLGIKRVE